MVIISVKFNNVIFNSSLNVELKVSDNEINSSNVCNTMSSYICAHSFSCCSCKNIYYSSLLVYYSSLLYEHILIAGNKIALNHGTIIIYRSINDSMQCHKFLSCIIVGSQRQTAKWTSLVAILTPIVV